MVYLKNILLDAAIEPWSVESDAGAMLTGVILIVLLAVVAAAAVIAAILVIRAVRKEKRLTKYRNNNL